MENCLSKTKFISAERVQAHGHSKHTEQTIGLHFISYAVGPCPPYSDWSNLGAHSVHDYLMLYLEFGDGVVVILPPKVSSVNKNLKLQAAKMVIYFDRKHYFPHKNN
jgi:hypothetical protein